jgi:hypothetical protein
MANSTKLRDIQPGRLLQIAEKNGKRPTSMVVKGVRQFQSAAQVSGVKLMRNGEPHSSGKTHFTLVEDGDFLVTWEGEEAPRTRRSRNTSETAPENSTTEAAPAQ